MLVSLTLNMGESIALFISAFMPGSMIQER